MKEKLKQLTKLASRPLDTAEKNEMKREFQQFLDTHPLPHRDTHVLPSAPYRIFLAFRSAASYAVIGFVMAGSFTVGASEFSLPNDPLYAVKTGVNERMLLATTYFSPALHAKAGHVMFTRRLEEAEQLMLLEQFSAHTADVLEAEISEHAEALNRSIERVEAAGDSDEAVAVRLELEETLEKYDSIIDIIELRSNASDKAVIDNFIKQTIEAHAAQLRSSGTEEEFAEIEHEIMEHYAESLLRDLEELNIELSNTIAMHEEDAEEFLSEEARSLLAASNADRAQAEDAIAGDDPEIALKHLENALQSVRRAFALVTEQTNEMPEMTPEEPTASTTEEVL